MESPTTEAHQKAGGPLSKAASERTETHGLINTLINYKIDGLPEALEWPRVATILSTQQMLFFNKFFSKFSNVIIKKHMFFTC
jgi:hypothetical protein